MDDSFLFLFNFKECIFKVFMRQLFKTKRTQQLIFNNSSSFNSNKSQQRNNKKVTWRYMKAFKVMVTTSTRIIICAKKTLKFAAFGLPLYASSQEANAQMSVPVAVTKLVSS